MNLLVSHNLAAVRPDALPPARRSGPARVLFLSSSVLGWKTSSRQLVEATADRADIAAVHVLTRAPRWMKPLVTRLPGLRRGLVHPFAAWRWQLGRWLTGPLDVGRFDAVHCNPQALALAPADLKSRYDFKLSVACDTTNAQYRRELAHLPPGPRVDFDRVALPAADLVLSLSTWCAGSLRNDYGVDPAKIMLMPPSAPVPADVPPREPRAGRLLRIAFVGNDFARKGGPRLLAWHQARWADRVELHVASAEAANHAGAKNVVFHGRLDHAAVLALLGRSDLLVHPTTADMSALVVAEAASRGVPAVASRLAGIPDLIDDGVTGRLIAPADDSGFVAAVESILFDEARHAEMSAAARRFALAKLDSTVAYRRAIDRIVAMC